MTLAPLATPSDLTDRNIAIPSTIDPDAIIASVSAAVRDAAGCAILSTTSTIQLIAPDDAWLDLPAGPVTAVSSVFIAADPPLVLGTDYVVVADALCRINGGWLSPNTTPPYCPTMVTVAYTHGLAELPKDILDLVCALSAMAISQADGQTYGVQSQLQAERLGDYSATYHRATGALSGEPNPSPVNVPDGTRNWLRARFGTGVGTTGTRR